MAGQESLEEMETVRELVREAGLRCTAARLAVMRELRQANAPLSHAEVADSLEGSGFDKVTVFRNLTDLTEAGLLTRTELGDHVWRFELRDPDEPTHPHFVCIDCGTVSCLSDISFDRSSQKKASRLGQVTEILLKGRCNACI